MTAPGRIAFVPPRFGPGVVGGSEAVSREVALGMAARGWDVEVVTTCAVDHYTWDNDLPSGHSVEEGLSVHRFETRYTHGAPGRTAQDLMQQGQVPTLDEQVSWVNWRFSVPGLFHHLLRHRDRWDAIVFSPYLFWTTTVCLPEVAERAVAMPCLHDETYARLDVVRPVLASPARVWFLSEPEHELAHRLGPVSPKHTVPGAGVHVPERYDPEGFRSRRGLPRPFITFTGRRERDKGWDWLLDLFAEVARRLPVDLVTLGVGEVKVPAALRGRVHDLGFVDEHERDDAIAASLAYVQPSRMESFSRSVMEGWLAGTPVLAVEDGEVVAWHCRRSGGGLLFRDAQTFGDAIQRLLEQPAEAAELAERGRRYVLDHYRWPVVIDAMEEDVEGLRAELRR